MRRLGSRSIVLSALLGICVGSLPTRADVQQYALQDEADGMIEACFRYAAEQKWTPLSVAVVDEGGALVEFKRQKGASALTADAAVLKARSAVRARDSTAALSTQDAATRDLLVLEQVTALPGGVPIMRGHRLVGAAGVSGAKPEQDAACAQRAVAAARK